MRRSLGPSLCALAICVASLAVAAPSSLRSVSLRLSFLKKLPTKHFDGKRFIRFQKAYHLKYVNKLNKELTSIVMAFKRAPAAVRGTPDGQRMANQLRAWLAYSKAVTTAYNSRASSGAAGDAKCKAFFKNFKKPNKIADAMMHLMGRGAFSGRPMRMRDIAIYAKGVARICAHPAFKDVGKVGCRSYRAPKSSRNPAEWCATAPRWQAILKSAVDKRIAKSVKSQRSATAFAKRIPDKEGWVSVNSWAEIPLNSDEKKTLLQRYQKMYEDIEIKAQVSESLLKPLLELISSKRKWMQDMAGTWKMPAGGKAGYALALGKRALRQRSGAKLVRAYLGKGGWILRKGIVKRSGEEMVKPRRRRDGYLLYRVKGQKLCQLQSFSVFEYFDGKRFARASSAVLGKVRFHKC